MAIKKERKKSVTKKIDECEVSEDDIMCGRFVLRQILGSQTKSWPILNLSWRQKSKMSAI